MGSGDGRVTAKDLHNIASQPEARELLPVIVRRLLATNPTVRGLSAHAAAWRPGWDVRVEDAVGDAHVPDGCSRWELGAGKHPARKADEDYQKRSRNPQGDEPQTTAFVFVTMQHWREKHEWSANRRREKIWRDVRVIDSEDLCTWLESHDDVHAWVSEQVARMAAARSPRPAQLPRDAVSFVGRREEIDRLALGRGSSDAPVVISGPPGVGKTALAVHAAYSCAESYPDGQLYVDLEGTSGHPRSDLQVLAKILRDLGVPLADSQTTSEDLVSTYRSALREKKVVLLLDNAASESQVRPLIPGQTSSLVLVTSRIALEGLDDVSHIRLGELPEQDAIVMLANYVGQHRVAMEPAACAEIVNACGRLPLALRIAGSLSRRAPSWPLRSLASRLHDERRRLDLLAAGDLAVRASFQLSYDLLGDQERKAFRRLALIPGPTFDSLLARAALDSETTQHAEDGIVTLVQRGLVEHANSPGRYLLHDLLRLFGEERAGADDAETERDTAIARICRYVVRVVTDGGPALDPALWHSLDGEVRGMAEDGRLRAWFDDNLDNAISVLRRAVDEQVYNIAIQMLLPLSTYVQQQERWTTLREIAELGQEVVERIRVKGTLNPEAAEFLEPVLLQMLAESSAGMRDYDSAHELCDNALAKVEGVTKELLVPGLLNTRGNILRSQRKFEDALRDFQEALARWESLGQEPQTYKVHYNIGATLADLGRTDEAMPYLRRDLEYCQQNRDLLGEARTRNTLGLALFRSDELDQAEEMLTAAVELYRSRGDLLNEGRALNDLGLVYHARDNHEEAIQCHSLDLLYCRLRRDQRGAALASVRLAENLALDDHEQGQLALALTRFALMQLDPETDAGQVGSAFAMLGKLGCALGHIGSAEQMFGHAATMCTKANDPVREYSIYLQHGETMTRRGLPERAIDPLRRAAAVAKTPLNDAGLEVYALRHLGDALSRNGQHVHAQDAYKHARSRLAATVRTRQ